MVVPGPQVSSLRTGHAARGAHRRAKTPPNPRYSEHRVTSTVTQCPHSDLSSGTGLRAYLAE